MLINTTNFLEVAKDGVPKLIPGSLDYIDYWTEQRRRCIEGFTVGGKWMPGPLYHYGNFATIRLNAKDAKGVSAKRKSKSLPDITDLEWELAFLYDEAKNEPNIHRVRLDRTYDFVKEGNLYRPAHLGTKGVILGGSRDSGKSYFAANLASYEYTFFEDNEVIISASVLDYTRDLMNKIRLMVDNYPGEIKFGPNKEDVEPAPFSHKRLKDDWEDEVRSGYYKNDGTRKIHGYNTVLWNIGYNHDSMAANGKRPGFHVFEEIGAWTGAADLIDCYGHSEPCWKTGIEWFAVPWLQGTGGNMKKGTASAMKMFYNPEAYNLLAFDDKWEKKGKTGYFIPATIAARQFKDKEGNTQYEKAQNYYLEERKKKETAKDNKTMMNFIMYYPLKPSEMFLKQGSNIFPTRLLNEQLSRIENSDLIKSMERRGFFEYEEGELKWKEDSTLVPAGYAHDEGNRKGCIQIWELPEDEVYNDNLYIAGTDPYDQDESQTSSLGSTFIFKTFNTAGQTYFWPVAEYTGRPDRSEEYYENARLLLTGYKNAKDLYENNFRGFMTYMKQKKSLHLLKEQPDELIKAMVKDSNVERGYGLHVEGVIKRQLEEYTRDWLLQEYAPGRRNLEKIYSTNLLKELIDYERDGNYDRVIAFMLCIAQLKELEITGFDKPRDKTEEEHNEWELDYYAR